MMSYEFILLIFFVLIVVYLTFNYSNTITEGYDGRISNISLTECGTECTTGYDCTGFAYKPINNICYLSKK